jgi:hypothetical protein
MAGVTKELYTKLLDIEVEEGVMPVEGRAERVKAHIEAEQYEEALYFMALYLIKAIVETYNVGEDEARAYIEELVKILDQLHMPNKNIEVLTRKFIWLLAKYTKVVRLNAILWGNFALAEKLKEEANFLEEAIFE